MMSGRKNLALSSQAGVVRDRPETRGRCNPAEQPSTATPPLTRLHEVLDLGRSGRRAGGRDKNRSVGMVALLDGALDGGSPRVLGRSGGADAGGLPRAGIAAILANALTNAKSARQSPSNGPHIAGPKPTAAIVSGCWERTGPVWTGGL
jgi:hypothetical protein